MNRFELETAIITWRRFLWAEGAISKEDADELEAHLRDHFDELVSDGLEPQNAFEQALRQLGGYALIEKDYKDVFWKKVRAERRVVNTLLSNIPMFKNYFKVSIRYMLRQPVYTFINVLGLALGLVGCLFISMFVWNEIAFDRFHDNANNIYRLVQETDEGSSAKTAGGHADLVKQSIPDVETTVRVAPWKRTITVTAPLSSEQSVYSEPGFIYADPTFFDVFSFQLIAGDEASALSNPGSVVITEATAGKYFGDIDPIGQVILMYDGYSDPNQIPLTITGVVSNPLDQSHLPLSVIASTGTLESQYGPLNKLDWPGLYTYMLLPNNFDVQRAEKSVTSTLTDRLENEAIELRLQPLKDIYLHPQDQGELGVSGSVNLVYGLACIAFIVLLLACSNFTNLALARATTRIRELGVRRAMGAFRTQLAAQFLADSVLLTGIAVLIALGLAWAGKSLLNTFTTNALLLNWGTGVLLVFIGLILITSLLAGAYPAVLAARQQPTQTLRGQASIGTARLRSALIIFQFASCIVLMAGAFVIHRQVDYARSIRLGFNQEHIVTIQANRARRSFQPLSEVLLGQMGVLAVSGVNGVPGLQEVRASMVVQPSGERETGVPIQTQGVGPGFFDMLDIRLVAGRFPVFNTTPGSSIKELPPLPGRLLVINETAAASLGWSPEEALEQPLQITEPGNEANNPGITGTVVGVVADFHHSSARIPITAFTYYSAQSIDVPNLYVISHVLVKLASGNMEKQIQQLKAAWHQILPDQPFEAAFLDDQIQTQYEADVRLGRAIGFFAGLAILIASMGLFGLASFMAQRRTKEVGIRKVLGASEMSMLILLTGKFLKLVSIAFIIAAPLAYLALKHWIEDFAYRIDLGPGIFLLIGILVLLIALVAVSYQTIKVARSNPVDALRYE